MACIYKLSSQNILNFFSVFSKNMTPCSDGIKHRNSVKLLREPGLLPQGMTSASKQSENIRQQYLSVRPRLQRTTSVPYHSILSNLDLLQAIQCPLQNRVLFELLTLVLVARSEEGAVVHLHLLRVVGRLLQPLLVQLLLDDLVTESVLFPVRRGLPQLDLLGNAEGRS